MGTTDGNGVYTPDLDEEGWDAEVATNFDLFSQNITDTAAHIADTTAAHAASAVSFSPTGTVGSTTVQAAIAEVAAEAATANTADISTHAGLTDPHAGYVLESLLDAKGDLITASANDTPAKLTVGADDTILMADSSAGGGLKWVASASPSAVGTAAATGTADTFTRGDHVHAHETAHTGHDTIWDAKGDLVVATGADAAAKVAVGSNGQVLVADSAATSGVSWRTKLIGKLAAVGSAISTTEAVLVSGTIPANTLSAGDTFVIEAIGKGTTGVTPGTGTWVMRLGPTTLTGNVAATSGGLTLVASRTDKAWLYRSIVQVYTIGGSGTVAGSTVLDARPSTNDFIALTSIPFISSTAAVAIDTTVDNLIELTFVTSQAGSSATVYNASIVKA